MDGAFVEVIFIPIVLLISGIIHFYVVKNKRNFVISFCLIILFLFFLSWDLSNSSVGGALLAVYLWIIGVFVYFFITLILVSKKRNKRFCSELKKK